jgi:hypothetical protein
MLFTRKFFKWLVAGVFAAALAGCSPDSPFENLPDLAPMSGDSPMLRLGPGNLPLQPPVVSQLKYEYYQCDTLVSDWFLKLLVAEMNFLEKKHDLVAVDGSACAVSRALEQGHAEPRYTVHLFGSRKAANECVVSLRCELARNVALVPRQGAVWRSYFLSDFRFKKYYNECLAPPQRWYPNISCDNVPFQP